MTHATITCRFTRADKLASLTREISYRKRVYPRQVAAGKMRPYTADREIAVMKEIAADYTLDDDGLFAAGGVGDADAMRDRAEKAEAERDNLRDSFVNAVNRCEKAEAAAKELAEALQEYETGVTARLEARSMSVFGPAGAAELRAKMAIWDAVDAKRHAALAAYAATGADNAED